MYDWSQKKQPTELLWKNDMPGLPPACVFVLSQEGFGSTVGNLELTF